MSNVEIKIDDLRSPEIAALLQHHLDYMFFISPAESVYALDMDALRVPEIVFWSAHINGMLVGCVALKDHGNGLGEIKSMHTHSPMRGRGIARHLVAHLIAEAKARGFTELKLETGHSAPFQPAIKLYESFGFSPCSTFADYGTDPHCYFMSLQMAT